MKDIILVSMLISFLIVILLCILEKTIKNIYNDRFEVLYKTVIYISEFVFIISLSYFFTDTVYDFTRIVGLFVLVIIIIELYSRFIEGKKHDWLVLCIIIFIVYGCYIFALQYMLCSYNSYLIFGVYGGLLGSYMGNSNHKKGKIFISWLVIFTILSVINIKYKTEIFNLSKPKIIAIKEVQSKGYDIDNDDILRIINENNRFEPIDISILRIDDNQIERLYLTYYKERIIKFELK